MIEPSYNYIIKISPLDYYFFGSEATFGNNEQQNYFAKTQLFPQQTSVVGLLRHLGYGRLDIGVSFDATKSQQNLGYIKALSPVYLVHKDQRRYLPGPLGIGSYGAFSVKRAGTGIKTWKNGSWTQMLQAPDYVAKDGSDQKLVAGLPESSKTDVLPFDAVFKTFTKIGITKQLDDGERKDGFYKQSLVKLESGWSFAVLANLDETSARDIPHSAVMPFGAEKSLFHIAMNRLEQETNFRSLFPDNLWDLHRPAGLDVALLLGDAWVPQSLATGFKFAVTEIRDFRYIRTPSQVRNFARFYTHEDWRMYQQDKEEKADTKFDCRLYKSGKYNLLSRGSILYGNVGELTRLLDQPGFKTIGYNHYTIITNH